MRLLHLLLLALVIAGAGTIGLGALLTLMAAVAWWSLIVAVAGLLAVLAVATVIELGHAPQMAAPVPVCRCCGRRHGVDHTGLCEPCREKD